MSAGQRPWPTSPDWPAWKTAASMVLNGREGTRLSADAHQRVFAAAAQLGYRSTSPPRASVPRRPRPCLHLGHRGDHAIRRRHDPWRARRREGAQPRAADRRNARRPELRAARDRGDARSPGRRRHLRRDGDAPARRAGDLVTRPTVLLNAASTDSRPCVLPASRRARGCRALIEAGHCDRIGLIGRNRLKESDPEISLAAAPGFAVSSGPSRPPTPACSPASPARTGFREHGYIKECSRCCGSRSDPAP